MTLCLEALHGATKLQNALGDFSSPVGAPVRPEAFPVYMAFFTLFKLPLFDPVGQGSKV